MGVGFALALIATTATQLARPWTPVALLTIGAIAFGGGMVTGMGRWAIAVGMQAIIPMVFVLGFPHETLTATIRIETLFAAGGLGYIGFALLATVATHASARRLVASESIRELSLYLRAVAAVFDPESNLESAYGKAIRQQAALSEQLQSARALLLDRVRRGSESRRLAATIGIMLDAFDALVAAQCDVALIRGAAAAAPLLSHIRAAMRVGALDLDHLSLEILTTSWPTLPADHQLAIDAVEREAGSSEGTRRRPAGHRGGRRRGAATHSGARRYPKARKGAVGREDGRNSDRRRRPRRLPAETRLFPRRAPAAPHPGLPRFALFGEARARHDGRSGRRASAWRFRPWQLGPADDLGHHAGELRSDQAPARRSGHRHPDRVRPRRRGGRLAAGERAGRRAGTFARRDAQLRPAQLCARLRRSVGDRAGVAASRAARSARAHCGAPRRHASRRRDRPSVQLRLAALGVRRGAGDRDPPPHPARDPRRRGAPTRRRGAGIPARSKEHDRGAGRAFGFGRADEHRADRDPEGNSTKWRRS